MGSAEFADTTRVVLVPGVRRIVASDQHHAVVDSLLPDSREPCALDTQPRVVEGPQGSEAVLGCEILNRMTALGRPVSYRIGR